jgi:hypothetical protein
MLVLLADNSLAVLDLSKFAGRSMNPVRMMETTNLFNYGIRSICVLPENNGCTFGSFEGRVAFYKLNLNPSVSISKEYVFKCHRDASTMSFPIHEIAYHRNFRTVATAGGDGSI